MATSITQGIVPIGINGFFPPGGQFNQEKIMWLKTILRVCVGYKKLNFDASTGVDFWNALDHFQQTLLNSGVHIFRPFPGWIDDVTLTAVTQRALNHIALGLPLVVNGIYVQTSNMIRRFQTAGALLELGATDGIVDRITRRKMKRVLKGPQNNWVKSESDVGSHLGDLGYMGCEKAENSKGWVRGPVYLWRQDEPQPRVVGSAEYDPIRGRHDYYDCRRNGPGYLPEHSTAPDFYHPLKKIAVEVKNKSNRDDLVINITRVRQQGNRFMSMPRGFAQWLFVEVRGRLVGSLVNYTFFVISKLREAGGPAFLFDKICFITEFGMYRYHNVARRLTRVLPDARLWNRELD